MGLSSPPVFFLTGASRRSSPLSSHIRSLFSSFLWSLPAPGMTTWSNSRPFALCMVISWTFAPIAPLSGERSVSMRASMLFSGSTPPATLIELTMSRNAPASFMEDSSVTQAGPPSSTHIPSRRSLSPTLPRRRMALFIFSYTGRSRALAPSPSRDSRLSSPNSAGTGLVLSPAHRA